MKDNIHEIIKHLDNPFIEDFEDRKINYTKDFYVAMYLKLKEGCNPKEAYQSLGFDISVFGEDRAYACARRAMKKASEDSKYTVNPSSYDGSVDIEYMGDLTPEEELAYLKARNAYLETIVEFQKKNPLILEEIITSLKKN